MPKPASRTNRLARERSPYLLQHAQNLVDWYPWGAEALAKALEERKPILLSCGYSSCHWCHVMAHESFEDPEIARLMNEYFVNIKVDREERPEIDRVYQEACRILTRQGGWPLTVFLTPEAKPFYAGTYFPPVARHGYPGFGELVRRLGEAYRTKPEELESLAEQLTEAVVESLTVRPAQEDIDLVSRIPSVVKAARENIYRYFDSKHGGLLGAPKFPAVPQLELLWSSPVPQHKAAVEFTLEKMIAGGIYDQLGGGFHRYATDEAWLIPHFEKMLYDNALLLDLMSRVTLATGNKTIAQACRQTAEFVLREFSGELGEFFTSLDADVAGREGLYYLWTAEEIDAHFPAAEADRIKAYFGVTETGNFEHGHSVLHRTQTGPVPESLLPAVGRLLALREQRRRPLRDEKVIAGWNGLMIKALAQAAAVFDNARYLAAAQQGMRFLLEKLTAPDHSLSRSYLAGRSEVPGFCADYAQLIAALLALYETTHDESYLEQALKWQTSQFARFYVPQEGGFRMAERAAGLPVMPKDDLDEALPSGLGQTLFNLASLSRWRPTVAKAFREQIKTTIRLYFTEAAENPWGYATFLRGAEACLGEIYEEN
ncbi:MAG: thioredoxin domain-containing protein [Firmicutes bacterium]|nr:thioredoxin domain-containing protein [Bacillota bacterium]